MNDPAHDDHIAEAATELQNKYSSRSSKSKSSSDKENGTANPPSNSQTTLSYQSPAYSKPRNGGNDIAHQLPTRWWYASTGFPLVAGTFGPMASAFSICALVENWRVEVPAGGTEEHGIDIPDPRWLIAVNAVSLVFALVANLSLLLNMAKRVPFRYAQPVTISGFWISSVLLTVLVGYAAHDFHAPGVQKQALTQAYYYGCWAAGLYQLISLMMCVTVYGAVTHRYSSEFNLTMAQRTLMLQTIAFLTYLLVGALIFSKIEGWKFLNAVYWSDFTLLTVGIGGDLTPTTHLGRSLLFPFSIGGIVTLGLVVSSIRTMVLDRGKRKLHARMTEKMRRKVVKQVDEICAEGKARRRKVTGLNKSLVRRLTMDPTDDANDELERRSAEFEAMRRVEDLTSRRQKWMNLVVSTTAFAILWFLGALVFYQTEGRNQGWSYFTALYFSWTSLLTIGYGDFIPLSNAGRPFFVFWSLLAVPSLTILISDMGDTVVKGIKDATIWIGEISILPSSQGSIMERFKYGMTRALYVDKLRKDKAQDDEDSTDSGSEESRSQFMNPGLVKLFKIPHHLFGSSTSDREKNEIVKDLEKVEQEDERETPSQDDQIAKSEHHYRHILIAEIRKLYAHTNSASPKKYTYVEWAYYLKLLGEDESSSEFHRHAPVKSYHKDKHQNNTSKVNNSGKDTESSNDQPQQSEDLMQWSWLGPRSPLMTRGDQSESQWLVARLFERLEESLRDVHKEKDLASQQPSKSALKSGDTANSSPESRISPSSSA